MALDIIVDILARHSNLFLRLRMLDVPRAHIRVLRFLDAMGRRLWPHKVHIVKFLAAVNDSRNGVLFHAKL